MNVRLRRLPARRVTLPIALAGVIYAWQSMLSIYATSISTNTYDIGIDPSTARQVAYLAIVLGLMGVVAKGAKSAASAVPLPALFVVSWFSFSCLWSSSPQDTLKKTLLISVLMGGTFVSTRELGLKRVITISSAVLLFFLVANYASVVLQPEVGVTRHEAIRAAHQWRGIFSEKNEAGAVSAITVLFFCLGKPFANKMSNYCVGAAAFLFVVMSQSKTATYMLLPSLALGMWLQHRSPAHTKSIGMPFVKAVVLSGLPALLIVLAITFAVFSGFLGQSILQDPEIMTRRGYIWRPLLESFISNPVAGTGLGGFWTIPGENVSSGSVGWLQTVGQAHNGYLDVLVQTGLVGLALVLSLALSWPIFRVLRSGVKLGYVHALPAALLLFILGSNATESGLLDRDVVWGFYLVVALAMLRTTTSRERRTSSTKVNH